MSTEELQAANIIPPRAGQLYCVAVSAVASSVDMSTIGVQTQNMGGSTATSTGCLNRYVHIYADGADLYIITGATQGAVTGGNVPAAATVGKNVAGVAWKIPSGTYQPFRFAVGVDNWLGFVASGAGTMRIAPASHIP